MKLNANHIGWMCLIAPLALSGCKVGGGGSGDSEAAPVARSCDSLNAMTIAAEDIGLPTRGAHVLAAEVQVAGETTPEFCRVSVQIEPFDPAALPINVQVNLPQTWNGKALHIGGGGYNGVLITGEDTLVGSASYPAPLVEGYATFGSDGGNAVNNAFGAEEHVQNFLNDEVVANYFGDQLKKTHDVAIALITEKYGAEPSRTYFSGASNGGREALQVTQRFGADYDGVVSFFPAAGAGPMVLYFGELSRALAEPGAYSGPEKQRLVQDAVMSACDLLDGAQDGLISNPSACQFDPQVLRCPSGFDEGNTCLSDAQITALNVVNDGLKLPYTFSNGELTISSSKQQLVNQAEIDQCDANDGVVDGAVADPFNCDFDAAALRCPSGTDEGNSCLSDPEIALINGITGEHREIVGMPVYAGADITSFVGLGSIPPTNFPAFPGSPLHTWFYDVFYRGIVARDPAAESLAFDPKAPGIFMDRLNQLSPIAWAGDPDLSTFQAHGGKLILLHGAADALIPVDWSRKYYEKVVATMGEDVANGFMRYFDVPGYNHAAGQFIVDWDALAALDNWVENGNPVEGEVIADIANGGRTRPLCAYPLWPEYDGSGDINDASSFSCVAP